MHLELKCFALLVAPSLLEAFVVSSDEDRAMGLSARNAGSFMRAAMTLAAKLKTVGDFSAFALSQFAAVGAGLSIGTDGFSFGNADVKGFDSIRLFQPGTRSTGLSRSHQCLLLWLGRSLAPRCKLRLRIAPSAVLSPAPVVFAALRVVRRHRSRWLAA